MGLSEGAETTENVTFDNVRKLSPTAKQILNKRYLWEGEKTWDELVNRVVNYVIPKDDKDFEIIKEMIMHRYFMPNSPCLANAGKDGAGLCACLVVDFEDTIEDIYKTKLEFALIARKGGGCGTTLSKLRPKGADVKGSTHGYAGGPVAFANTISTDMSVITQGGLRSMAIMFTMSVYHPDILEFIGAKEEEGKIANANMSVVVDNAFMEAVRADKTYWTEFNGKKHKEYKAREVFDKIVEGAWRNGEPGLLFSNRINDSPYQHTGQTILATNPCSEQPLPANGVCNLGSIDLSKFVSKGTKVTDYEKLKLATELAVKFLDNVVDKSSYPTPEISQWAKDNRAIGVGIMGFADYCLMKEVSYGSDESLKELDYLLSNIYIWALNESEERGKTLGVPKECKKLPVRRRNITLTTIAPTGTVSLIAGASSGIEPLFSEIVVRNDKTGTYVFETDLANKPYFKCAVSTNGVEHEVTWEEHVKILATAQKNIDSGVSKCLLAGTIIPTNKGLIPIEEFSNVENPDSFVNIEDNGYTTGGNKILEHYFAGLKESTKVTLNNGASITGASDSHKVMTTKGWILLRDIKIGDIVLGKTEESHGNGGEPIFFENSMKTNSNKITPPKKMTLEFAEWLGMITADGNTTVSTGYVGISCKDENVEKRFSSLTNSVFGIHPKTIEDKRNGVKSLYVTSRNLSRFINKLIGSGAYNKTVPNQILIGSKEEKIAYLSGLSLDGYISKNKKSIHFYVYFGMSKDLAYRVSELCRSFGFQGTYIASKNVRGYGVAYGVKVPYELKSMLFCPEIHKNKEITKTDYFVYVPRRTIETTRVSLKHPKYYALKNMRLFRKNQEFCFESTAKEFGWDTSILAYKVTAVECVGLKELFDISVEGSHEYLVNGMISHNTINFPNHTHRETIYKAMVMAWELGCKGIAVYRNGSRKMEVLSPKNISQNKCPLCGKDIVEVEGKKCCTDQEICKWNLKE